MTYRKYNFVTNALGCCLVLLILIVALLLFQNKSIIVFTNQKDLFFQGTEVEAIPSCRVHSRSLGVYEITAYCPGSCCCGKWADGITASGHKIEPGDVFVAAPKRIPFETLLIIPGYADSLPVRVLDRGGAITDGHIDVFFATHQEALVWGRQKLEIQKVLGYDITEFVND